MDYFKDCECQETAKEKYRSLAKKLHPDKGGTKEEMAELTKQYERFKKYGAEKTHGESIFEEMQRQYTQARQAYDEAFTGRSTRFRRFNQAEEEQPKARPNGQTAGWRTNKPHTNNEGYGDIPWDHPIRQELFQLRNRLAELDNTYRRPRPAGYEDKVQELDMELKRLHAKYTDLMTKNSNLEAELKLKESNFNQLGTVIDKQEETIKTLQAKVKSQQLKFKNMRFFAKICYLFLPD